LFGSFWLLWEGFLSGLEQAMLASTCPAIPLRSDGRYINWQQKEVVLLDFTLLLLNTTAFQCAHHPNFHDKAAPLAVPYAASGGAYKDNMMMRFLPVNSDSKACRNMSAEICSNQSFVVL